MRKVEAEVWETLEGVDTKLRYDGVIFHRTKPVKAKKAGTTKSNAYETAIRRERLGKKLSVVNGVDIMEKPLAYIKQHIDDYDTTGMVSQLKLHFYQTYSFSTVMSYFYSYKKYAKIPNAVDRKLGPIVANVTQYNTEYPIRRKPLDAMQHIDLDSKNADNELDKIVQRYWPKNTSYSKRQITRSYKQALKEGAHLLK